MEIIKSLFQFFGIDNLTEISNFAEFIPWFVKVCFAVFIICFVFRCFFSAVYQIRKGLGK